jgi:hypothetical protein
MMFDSDEDIVVTQRILVMRIILGALIGGCLAFLIIAVIYRQARDPAPAPTFPIMTYMALGFGIFWTALSFFVPDFFVAAERRKMAQEPERHLNDPQAQLSATDAVKLVGLCQTRLIVGAALVEGCVFFFIIAYMLEGSLICLVGALVLLGIMATRFPTRIGVERWVEAQRELLQQERAAI